MSIRDIWTGPAYAQLAASYRTRELCVGCKHAQTGWRAVTAPIWKRSSVARAAAHHVVDGVPLYDRRFALVLKFHAPGLAPAVDSSGAFHIRPDGSDAYVRRFVRTFGFYEGRATVVAVDGWHHIAPCGDAAYASRFRWCGNYQGGRCTVRDTDDRYFHIDPDRRDAYRERWRYAGDYRNGIAAVQRQDGRSTHIDEAGRPAHDRWFEDLDVFHKGFARARDSAGWTHLNREGKSAYARRFTQVEPFYNGQARVERFDGGLEVADERGAPIVELRPARHSEFANLSSDLVGFWRTHTIAAAVELGVFDGLPGTIANEARARSTFQRFGHAYVVENLALGKSLEGFHSPTLASRWLLNHIVESSAGGGLLVAVADPCDAASGRLSRHRSEHRDARAPAKGIAAPGAASQSTVLLAVNPSRDTPSGNAIARLRQPKVALPRWPMLVWVQPQSCGPVHQDSAARDTPSSGLIQA